MSMQDRLINYQGNREDMVSVGMLLTIPAEMTCRVEAAGVEVVRELVPFAGLVPPAAPEVGALVGDFVLVGLVVLVKMVGAGAEMTVVALTFEGYSVDLITPVTD